MGTSAVPQLPCSLPATTLAQSGRTPGLVDDLEASGGAAGWLVSHQLPAIDCIFPTRPGIGCDLRHTEPDATCQVPVLFPRHAVRECDLHHIGAGRGATTGGAGLFPGLRNDTVTRPGGAIALPRSYGPVPRAL